MSSIPNDLSSWAAKARSNERSTIIISVDFAESVSRLIVAQANRIAELSHDLILVERSVSNPTARSEGEW